MNQPDILQLQRGDESAFRALVEAWQDKIYNTVLGIVQQAADAEDITQEVFVQVFRSISSFKGHAQLSTWMYRIAVNAALEHERKKKRKKRWSLVSSLFGSDGVEAPLQPDFYHPGVAAEHKEQAALLFNAISQLPENQRIAFTLTKTEGLSYADVAAVMQQTESGVDSLIQRARQNLKKKLAGYYKENQRRSEGMP